MSGPVPRGPESRDPASRVAPAEEAASPEALLVSLDACGDEVRRRCADVLYGLGDPALAERLLERYPGCLLVSLRDTAGRCVTLTRSGRRITVASVAGAAEHVRLASALHRWLVELSALPAPATGLRDAGRLPG